jgi:hypothetical protein
MSHTIGCYVNDGLEVVTAGWELPIAPWSWGHQDSLYAFLAPPGKSPMAGADAVPAAAPASGPSPARFLFGAGAVLVGGFLLKFAWDASRSTSRVARGPQPMPREPWHEDEATLRFYGPAVERAKEKTRERRRFR